MPIRAILIAAFFLAGTPGASAQADIQGLNVDHANSRNKVKTVRAPEFPTRNGPTALAFQVSPGQCAGNRTYDDCKGARERSEVVDRSGISTGQEYWYGFSLLVPNGTTTIDPASTIVAQWQDAKGSGEITLGFGLYREGIELTQSDPRTRQSDEMNPPRPMVIKTVVPGSQMRGRWHDVKVQAIWSSQDDGRITVWINGRQVHSHQGANLNRNVAPNFKFGLYRSGLQKLGSPPPRQTVFFDNVRVGRSESDVTVN